jgi:hypothetical protein
MPRNAFDVLIGLRLSIVRRVTDMLPIRPNSPEEAAARQRTAYAR